MKSFTVHERADHPSDRIERGEALVFVKDGFHFGAALLPPAWFIGTGLWIMVPVYLLAVGGLTMGLGAIGLPSAAIFILAIAVHLLIGFEAGSLQRWSLERNGYNLLGTVQGRTRAESERRFFETWSPGSNLPLDWTRRDIAEANDVLASGHPPQGATWWPFGRTRRTMP